MPKKKTKAPTERHATAIRLNDAEYAPVRADLEKLNAGGVPVSFGAYAKHAVLSYARLRRAESMTRSLLTDIRKGSVSDGHAVTESLESILESSR